MQFKENKNKTNKFRNQYKIKRLYLNALIHIYNNQQIIIKIKKLMDKLIDRYPYKKILYLNWYEAAIAHLLLFKYYIQKYSQNVYFLISEQGIMLKAVTLDYLKKAEDQITKFFSAKIEELDITGSTSFYNNILEDIKEQTQKLKDSRDCPYINLVYSEKLRNSCLAMKKLGYTKPYQNWQNHQREKKGFCFLIVRPEHRWKQIATNINQTKKKQSVNQKGSSEKLWPVQISYEKFIWFYLKDSFKNFKKSLQIKQNKLQKCLTIIIKKDIQQLTDLQKQIETLTFFYRPTKPIVDTQVSTKIIVLSPLQIEKITELVYHQFGLTSFAKQLRKKMTGYLLIGASDTIQCYESQPTTSPRVQLSSSLNFLNEKQQLLKISSRQKTSIILKLGRRHHLIQYQNHNYVQMKIEKSSQNMQYSSIIRLRLPCIPRYYYWYEGPLGTIFLVREFYTQKFLDCFLKCNAYAQIFMLNSLINIVLQLHQKSIYLGSCLYMKNKDTQNKKAFQALTIEQLRKVEIGEVYMDNPSGYNFYHRIVVEPGLTGTKEEDIYRLSKIIKVILPFIKDHQFREEILSIWNENQDIFGYFMENLEEYLEARA